MSKFIVLGTICGSGASRMMDRVAFRCRHGIKIAQRMSIHKKFLDPIDNKSIISQPITFVIIKQITEPRLMQQILDVSAVCHDFKAGDAIIDHKPLVSVKAN